MATHMDPAPMWGPGMGTDTDPRGQTEATTVDPDRPMRLHRRHDRAWPCPIGPVVALGGTVSITWLVEAPDEKGGRAGGRQVLHAERVAAQAAVSARAHLASTQPGSGAV